MQANKQQKKKMPASMVNVTLLLTSLLKLIEFFNIIINNPGQLIRVITLHGPVCVRGMWLIHKGLCTLEHGHRNESWLLIK